MKEREHSTEAQATALGATAADRADGSYSVFTRRFWSGQLDLRPLGLYRIAFGIVLLLGLLDIWPVLFDLLSDAGVMPRSALLGGIVRGNRFSIMDFAGPPWAVVMVWVLALLAVFAFTVGWHSRLASVATFILVCGIHERNLLAFDGSENVMRVMLFWSMFMPLGGRYSVDAILRSARGLPIRGFGSAFPMRLGQFQIAWVYLNSFFYKWGGNHWHDGTALHYGLGLDHLFTRNLGKLLFNATWLTVPGTHFTMIMEGSFLFLIFFPYLQPRLKAIGVASGYLLHGGIWLLMNVGNFSYLMPALYFIFWEPEWAERLVHFVKKPFERRKLALIYDGVCPVCTQVATVMKGFDPSEALRLINFREKVSLAGLPRMNLADLERGVSAVGPDGAHLGGFRALAAAARSTPALWPLGALGSVGGIDWLGERVYRRLVAVHAPAHQAAKAVPVPAVPAALESNGVTWLPRSIVHGALGVLMAGCVWFSLPNPAAIAVPQFKAAGINFPGFTAELPPMSNETGRWAEEFHSLLQELELWQVWDMFSPNPMDTDIWLKGVGQLKDGTTVDVLHGDHGGPMPDIYPKFFFSRWTKWINNIAYAEQPNLLEYGRFLCRRWNNERPAWRAQLKDFKIFREQRATPGVNEEPVPWGEQVIWDHHCF